LALDAHATWQGGLHVACDAVMVSGVVYATGLQDSYFIRSTCGDYFATIPFRGALRTARGLFCIAGWFDLASHLRKLPEAQSALHRPAGIRIWF